MRRPRHETDLDGLRELYMEVVTFLQECGGVYSRMHSGHCRRVLECLDHDLYLIERDGEGRVSQFCAYWRIREEDLECAQEFVRPCDIFTGPVAFSVDYASRGGVAGSMRMFLDVLPEKEPGIKAGCFEHKGRLMLYDRTGESAHPWRLRRRSALSD